MKILLIIVILAAMNGLFMILFGNHDWLARGIFIGIVFALGGLFWSFK